MAWMVLLISWLLIQDDKYILRVAIIALFPRDAL